MGIREKIQKKIGKAFDGPLSDAVNPFTGSYDVVNGYDPVTEEEQKETITYTGRGVLDEYNVREVDGKNVISGDLKLICLVNEVSGIPKVGHKINTIDLITRMPQDYDVIKPNADPAGAHYEMQLRRA